MTLGSGRADSRDAGSVIVLYGSAKGLGATKTQVWHRNSPGIPGEWTADEEFGSSARVTGDFDGDGFTDLVLYAGRQGSWYQEAIGPWTLVLFGSPAGLQAADIVVIPEWSPGVAGNIDTTAAGDELAVVLKEGSHTSTRTRLYRDLRGDPWYSVIEPGTYGLPHSDPPDTGGFGACEILAMPYDRFAGEELVIGQSTQEGLGCRLWRLRGGPGGPPAAGPAGRMHETDGQGPVVGRWDTATGPLHTQLGDTRAATGARGVRVRAPRSTSWSGTITQETQGVPGVSERDDAFGRRRDLVDMNGDGTLDLVVGVPGESLGPAVQAGSVTVIHRRRADGSPTARGNYVIHQDKAGVPGTAQSGDAFGSAVHGDDFDGDGTPDIVISAPGDVIFGIRPGVLTVAYSRPRLGYRLLHQGTAGIPGANEEGDRFGDTLVK